MERLGIYKADVHPYQGDEDEGCGKPVIGLTRLDDHNCVYVCLSCGDRWATTFTCKRHGIGY